MTLCSHFFVESHRFDFPNVQILEKEEHYKKGKESSSLGSDVISSFILRKCASVIILPQSVIFKKSLPTSALAEGRQTLAY